MMYDLNLTCGDNCVSPLGMLGGTPPPHYYRQNMAPPPHPPPPPQQMFSMGVPPTSSSSTCSNSSGVVAAPAGRGSRNTEKRRERSKVAARCRRGKESEIFNEMSSCLPVSEQSRSQLDKASVMRLTLCDLKLKEMMESIEGFQIGIATKMEKEAELFDGLINSAVSGFVVVCSADGDVVYVSEGIQTCLGLSQYEVMGQSLLEYSHPCDHSDVKEMLASTSPSKNSSVAPPAEARSALFRMKSANSTRGRNVHHRSTNYKVVACSGRLFSASSQPPSEKTWFVGICEPLLHPSDVDIPLNKQTFLSKHSPDMKFEYVDESISEFLGYRAEDMVGKSLFDFYHACDGDGIARSFKSLYSKGQTCTERTRFLAKGGGWMWVLTQATTINNNAGKPTSVVCIHFVTSGVECEDEIVSHVQLRSENEPVIPIRKPVCPVVSTPAQVPVVVEKKPLVETTNLPVATATATKSAIPTVAPATATETATESLELVSPITGPILSKPTPSTTKIFAPRTEDMDTGFLMPVNNTLIKTKEVVPEDLTHLAPMAGDECVPISNVPLLDDLLQWLDAADMEYEVLEGYEEPLPLPLINAATASAAGNCASMLEPIPIPLNVLNGGVTVNNAMVEPLCPLSLGTKDDMILDNLSVSVSGSCENTCESPLLMRSTDPTLMSSTDPLLLSPFAMAKCTAPDSPMSSPTGSCAPSPSRGTNMDFMSSDIFSTFYSDNPSAINAGGSGGNTAGSSSHKSKAGGGYDDETFSGFPMVSDFQETLFSPSGGCFDDLARSHSPPMLADLLEGGGGPSPVVTGGGSLGPLTNLKLEGGASGGGDSVLTQATPNNPPPFALISTSKQIETGGKLKYMASSSAGSSDVGNEFGGQFPPEPILEEGPLPCKVAKRTYTDEQGNNKAWLQVAEVTPTNPPWKASVACGETPAGQPLLAVEQTKQQKIHNQTTIGTQTTNAPTQTVVVAQASSEQQKRQQILQQRQRQLQRYRQLLMNPVVLQALLLSGRLIAPATHHVSNNTSNSRKRNFVGKLLSNGGLNTGSAFSGVPSGNGTGSSATSNLPGAGFLDLPSALVELTTLDCEVNAPLNSKPLLDGPELITALDTEMS